MTAEEVKAALRRRFNQNGSPQMPTPWTCIEEYLNIDLWCLAAWTNPAPASRKCKSYPRIAIEVKVSRSDLKAELMKPHKRLRAWMLSDQFYIATPLGLLKDEEIAWKQPEYEPKDFVRPACPNNCRRSRERNARIYWKPSDEHGYRGRYEECTDCTGGYTGKSKVEEEAPMVWIPPDVGLIEVDHRGCKFTKHAPVNENRKELSPSQVGILARWISVRPDPFHARLREQKGLTHREERAMVLPEQLGGDMASTP